MTKKAKQALIKVNLGKNGGTVIFFNIEEMETWVNHEIQYWQWIQKCTALDNTTSAIWIQQSAPWAKLIQQIGFIKSEKDETKILEYFNTFEQILSNNYGPLKTLHSSTPMAKRINEYSDDPDDQRAILSAAYMLGLFIKAPIKVNLQRADFVQNFIIGLVEASFFIKGVNGISPAELKALEELRTSYSTLLGEFNQQIQENRNLFEKTVAQYESLSQSLTSKFDELYDSSKKTLEDITNTYDKKLALQSSVSYWTSKAGRHRNLSIGFGSLFVLSVILVGTLFFQEIYPFLKDASTDKPIAYWVLALILIGAVASIWIIRLVVRVLLSHIHLQRDASERSTMLLTYLALLREGAGLKEDDKKLILQALFRPSSTGIVKDDALPSGLYDFITKIKQ